MQELLANVQKHARAGEVSVIIRKEGEGEPEGLYMSVADDGIGFDPQEKKMRTVPADSALRASASVPSSWTEG